MPQPEGPRRVKSSPSRTDRSALSTAVTAPNRLTTPRIEISTAYFFFSSSHLASMSLRKRVLSASERLAAVASS